MQNNFHGKGIYFTNSTQDVEYNYENHEGPDPWWKIEDRAYELAEEKYGFSYEDTLTGDADIIDKLNEPIKATPTESNDAEKKPTRRSELHQKIVDEVKSRFKEKGFDFDKVLKNAKNLSTFATVDNIPQRVMCK